MTRFERLTLILTILFTGAAVWSDGPLFWVFAIGNAVMFAIGTNPRRTIVRAIDDTVGAYNYRRGQQREHNVLDQEAR